MKKILLVSLTVVPGLLLFWFFGGLAVWSASEKDWFISLGPWGTFGGFMLTMVSLMTAGVSFIGSIFLIGYIIVDME